MDKRLLIGISLVLLGILYGLQASGFINEETIQYILNYQVILIIVGLFVGIFKKKSSGWVILAVGIYLYVKEFFEQFANVGVTVGLLLVGVVLVVLSISDKKKKKTNEPVNISINKGKVNSDSRDEEKDDK